MDTSSFATLITDPTIDEELREKLFKEFIEKNRKNKEGDNDSKKRF